MLGANGGDRLLKSLQILHDRRDDAIQGLSGGSGLGRGYGRLAEDGCTGAGRKVSSGNGIVWS